MTGNTDPRQAIILSGWGWRSNGTPERLARALALAGWRILYCENPASFARRSKQSRFPLAAGVEGFRPSFLGHRVNFLPFGSKLQGKLLANQILEQARQAGLTQPIAIYPPGEWVIEVAREFKRRGLRGVFLCTDRVEGFEPEGLASVCAATLVIPRAVYAQLRAKLGDKIRLIPQLGPQLDGEAATPPGSRAAADLEAVPRPRLVFLGLPANRLHHGLLERLLAAHPDWHFVACGPVPGLRLPNVHEIAWFDPGELPALLRLVDVGFLPYDCSSEHILHGVALKLYDYFAAGLPVVSTPLLHLGEYGNLVYLGDTAEELAEGIGKALSEAPDDPRRDERRRIARAHSLESLSPVVSRLLLEAGEGRGGA